MDKSHAKTFHVPTWTVHPLEPGLPHCFCWSSLSCSPGRSCDRVRTILHPGGETPVHPGWNARDILVKPGLLPSLTPTQTFQCSLVLCMNVVYSCGCYLYLMIILCNFIYFQAAFLDHSCALPEKSRNFTCGFPSSTSHLTSKMF